MKKKKLKQILSCIALAVISLIIGYTIFIPNEKTEGINSPLAVYLQNGQSYTQSIIKDFDEILDDYEYDHIDCGSAAENAKWSWNNGTLSALGLNSHTSCKVYFKAVADFKISTITIDGVSASSVPSEPKYYVEPACTGATATWNYASWSLDVSNVTLAKAECSLAFTTVTSSNITSLFGNTSATGKYLNAYIKSLAGATSGTGNVTNYGSTNGTEIVRAVLNNNPTYTALDKANYGTAQYNVAGGTIESKYTFLNDKWSNTAAMSSNINNKITIPSAGFYTLCWTNTNTGSSYRFRAYEPNTTLTTATQGYNQITEQCYNYGYLTSTDYIIIEAKSVGENQITFYLKKSSDYTATTYYHDIGIRYVGANPNNYVKYNNELWRIIGIFREAKTSALSNSDTYYTKIIRNESIGGYAYNTIANTAVGTGAYCWWSLSNGSVATLNYLLNHYYIGAADDGTYNNIYDGTGNTNCKSGASTSRTNCDYRVIGIQPGWRDMIRNATWYTAAPSRTTSLSSANPAFSAERGNTASRSDGELSYTAKVGLMYPSDFLYSGTGTSTRWLLQNGRELTISPDFNAVNSVWGVSNSGDLRQSVYTRPTDNNAVRPTAYLSSEVYIIGGTGTLLDPYIINGR